MSLDILDSGEIPRPVGMNTVAIRMRPHVDLFTFRRPDATGELPVVIPDYEPVASPTDLGRTVILRHAPLYMRPAPSRRGQGRHRYPSLLTRTWRRLTGVW